MATLSYRSRKVGREHEQRKALVRGLAVSLVTKEKITTTVTKARMVVPFLEKLITKAKDGSLHQRRLINSRINSEAATEKLISEIAPRFKKRNGGYLRIKKEGWRRGDNARLATISFTEGPIEKTEAKKAKDKPKTTKSSPKKITKSAKNASTKKPATKDKK
ncbi:MAG: 50S ribosomal protein L17 [Candidatus Saccharimonadales bacterium]